MRILHVIPSLAPEQGGPSKACIELCGELAKRGHTVEVYTTNSNYPQLFEVPLAQPLPLGDARLWYFPVACPRRWIFSPALAHALNRAVPHFDLVHIHSLYLFPTLAAASYCRRYSVPYLIRPHGTLDPVIYTHHRYRKRLYEQFVDLRNLNGAAAVHFTSDDEAMLAEPLGLCAPSLVVPLGVDPRAYEHASDSDLIRARWPELDGQRLVLYLGRLHFKKGLRLLIQAFNDVSRHVPDARLVIAGPDRDGYKRTIARLIADLKLSDKVTFTGMLEGRFKTGMLKAASVFVLPSYGENLAFALLEAMASGTPVVATNRVNIWRDITDFAAGSVVECDPAQIAEAVRLFLRDPRAAQAAGQRGQDLVRRRYSWTTIAPRMIAAYERIVAGNLM